MKEATHHKVAAVVLAGGFGTRIKHLLTDIPKPMHPVSGSPFVEWVCRYLAHHNIKQIQISTGYLGETIAKHFSSQASAPYNANCIKESTPLGTGGGFALAANAIASRPDTWIVLNGDSLIFADLSKITSDFHNSGMDGALVGLQMKDASRYGSLSVGKTNELLGFIEKKPGPAIINAGLYILSDKLVKNIPKNRNLSFETDLFPTWLSEGKRFTVYPTEAPFLDIGTESSLPLAKSFISSNLEHFTIG